jgi:glutathione S-transferase
LTHRAGTRSLGRMAALTLVVGSRNYSSWSLRPWLLMRHLGLPFEERQFHLDTPEFDAEIAKISPTRRVPVLVHGEIVVWESLAICEYASELAGGSGWPGDSRLLARDLARIDALWSGCRRDQGGLGPWLFGAFSVADAMYAPVALRLRTYGLPLSSLATRYLDTMLGDARLREWIDAACRETQVIPHEEAGAGA